MKKVFLLLIALSSFAFAGSYLLDISHSSVNFSVKHMMISNVKGEFKKFEGDFALDEKEGVLQAMQGVVTVDSIDTGIAKRDAHLKSADFFDVAKFPIMLFVMTKYEKSSQTKGKMHGNLTIHGVTKPVVFDTEIGGVVKNPMDDSIRAGVSLNAQINRKDFGLVWNKALEGGGVIVGDDVKINIELEGIQK